MSRRAGHGTQEVHPGPQGKGKAKPTTRQRTSAKPKAPAMAPSGLPFEREQFCIEYCKDSWPTAMLMTGRLPAIMHTGGITTINKSSPNHSAAATGIISLPHASLRRRHRLNIAPLVGGDNSPEDILAWVVWICLNPAAPLGKKVRI